MNGHLTVDRGRIVEPRHLTLVVSNDWPDEADTDVHYADDGNPIAAAAWSAVTTLALIGFIGGLIWAVM
ncbi:hypothetical protein DK926_18700 [Rhodococcus sp. Eu-32]|uniref:hypothetical protein n=1 Tax=Rhodococcus sp. Eu-32 TaxID=1017319 RepID=UPI000DF384F1|nr:hypothetical protein [Rhodococcus sp. Eu-32]RRQ26278.1 hypothetical protein DK926_18700 [Rhodococcus sp. Eu-32]